MTGSSVLTAMTHAPLTRIARQGKGSTTAPPCFPAARRPARRASFRTGSSAEEPVSQDPLWYKDAVFYELHVKAFHDSNGDGRVA